MAANRRDKTVSPNQHCDLPEALRHLAFWLGVSGEPGEGRLGAVGRGAKPVQTHCRYPLDSRDLGGLAFLVCQPSPDQNTEQIPFQPLRFAFTQNPMPASSRRRRRQSEWQACSAWPTTLRFVCRPSTNGLIRKSPAMRSRQSRAGCRSSPSRSRSSSATAGSRSKRSAAESAVRRVKGLKGVTNTIQVKPRVPASEIKRKIEEAFRRSAEIDANRITVEAIRAR